MKVQRSSQRNIIIPLRCRLRIQSNMFFWHFIQMIRHLTIIILKAYRRVIRHQMLSKIWKQCHLKKWQKQEKTFLHTVNLTPLQWLKSGKSWKLLLNKKSYISIKRSSCQSRPFTNSMQFMMCLQLEKNRLKYCTRYDTT